MKYSAGLASTSFWFIESKKIAEFILEGYSKKEIMEMAIEENIFQVETINRIKEIVNGVYKRLSLFPEEILNYFIHVDVNSAKIFVLISILNNDKLFFEFMHEVFREHIILGNFNIKDADLDIFFMNKINQSEIVENWSEGTIKRLKSIYKLFLIESGLLEKEDNYYKIILPFIDYRLKELLTQDNLTPFLNAITGGV